MVHKIYEVKITLSNDEKLWSVVTVLMKNSKDSKVRLEGVLKSPVSGVPNVKSLLDTKILASLIDIFEVDYGPWGIVNNFIWEANKRWITKNK